MFIIPKDKPKERIKQGTIAQFMRKRTQLVGFEFGYWKHSQYCAEFLDNALDAIELFQWEEIKKSDSKFKFTLDQELSLENLTLIQEGKPSEESKSLNEELKSTLLKEFSSNSEELEEEKPVEIDAESLEDIEEEVVSEVEVEEEVKSIVLEMEEITKPVENIIDVEPIVIIRLREYEAPSLLTAEINQKNVMSYIFEIFDNGLGMSKLDLKKYGKYLASSKSIELKQTRGSQGFGAPSAFSDAQNTTGRPIITVSRSIDNIYATAAEFFTTSKNEKRYVVHPTDIDSPFLHGTYIKLHYLNTKYVRGYVDTYIKETAFMNPHITIIYIDPYGEEFIYPRKVSTFPKEPKYAKPHPSSANIGDLQDLLAKSENLTISSFLQENFVRISSKIAKSIIQIAEQDIQDKLGILILNDGFLTIKQKKNDEGYFLRYEKRVYGRSTKPRDKLIIYKLEDPELIENYDSLVASYTQYNKDIEKIKKKLRKKNLEIEKAETKKDIKNLEKEKRKIRSDIVKIEKSKEDVKTYLNNILKGSDSGLVEQKKLKNREELEDLVNQVQISKTKPAEITNDQFNSIFLAFKSIKYMAPPTDTAIPVGESVLENTIIKEVGLKVSENLDDFDIPIDNLLTTKELIQNSLENESKFKKADREGQDKELLTADSNQILELNTKILQHIDFQNDALESQELDSIEKMLDYDTSLSKDQYSNLYNFFIENYTKDDDFVAAETRAPTSGKGLAYVVEAVMAYSKNIEVPKRSRDVLSRFVNRTPKLRDSADCAITKAVQSVNWKNYKLDTYDNNLPKGPIKLLVNVSGPFVHLMFKSQSKNALADDENLIKEIKYCLEAIGRKLRTYINRKQAITKREKRSSLIEKYISPFVRSLTVIAKEGSKYKDEINEKSLQEQMKEAIGKRVPTPPPSVPLREVSKLKIADLRPVESKPPTKTEERLRETVPKKDEIKPEMDEIKNFESLTVKELKKLATEKSISIPSKIRKADIIKLFQQNLSITKPLEKEEKVIGPKAEKLEKLKVTVESKTENPKIAKPSTKPKPDLISTQTKLPLITTDSIMKVLTNDWQTITHLVFKLKIKDMMDARFLQIKLKDLERKGKVDVEVKKGKKHFKLKT